MAVIEATSKEFDSLVTQGDVVVDVYGDNCSGCRMLAPVIDQVACEMDMVRFVKINAHTYPEIAARYDITGIPTLLFMKDGVIQRRSVGALDMDALMEMVGELLYS